MSKVLKSAIATAFAAFLAVTVSTRAHATWSIVAVDPESGEVGLAAATCTPSVQYIAAAISGAGVVVAQAATSFKGRDQARDWIAEGAVAEDVLQRLSDPTFYDGWFDATFPYLQYGVATLTDGPQAGFTGGKRLTPWSGGVSAATYSVQGNTLRSQEVVARAAKAFEEPFRGACRLSLGERLIRALEAGREAGGDKRCPVGRPAQSAILIVAPSPLENDQDRNLSDVVRLVAPKEIGLLRAAYHLVVPYRADENSSEPIQQLREMFVGKGKANCMATEE